MISRFEFVSVNGMSFLLDEVDTPMRRFEMSVDWRFEEQEIPQGHGVFPSNSLLGKRLILCEGTILKDSTSEYMQERMNILGALSPFTPGGIQKIGDLNIDFDGISETVSAECTLDTYPSLPIEAMQGARGDYQINFKAFDPRFYGDETHTAELLPGVVSSGRAYPKTYPYGYTIGTAGEGDVLIANTGNVETFVTATIHGAATSPQIVIFYPDSTTDTFTLNYTLDTDDTVVIDFRNRTAILNGSVNIFEQTIGSTWWSLPPLSSYPIRYAPFEALPGTSVDLTWNNAYMI